MKFLEKVFIALIAGVVAYFLYSLGGWSSHFDKNLHIWFASMVGLIAFMAWGNDK